MVWNFFATSHGKGEVDGARTFLKDKCRKKNQTSRAKATKCKGDC
jgi:hypothetical protein